MLSLLFAVTLHVTASLSIAPQALGETHVVLRGSLGPVTKVRRVSGEAQAAAVLRPGAGAGGAPTLMLLGPFDDVRRLRLRPGARVVVRGRPARVAGRTVVVAASLERVGGVARPATTGLLGGRPVTVVARLRAGAAPPRGRAVDHAVTARGP